MILSCFSASATCRLLIAVCSSIPLNWRRAIVQAYTIATSASSDPTAPVNTCRHDSQTGSDHHNQANMTQYFTSISRTCGLDDDAHLILDPYVEYGAVHRTEPTKGDARFRHATAKRVNS